MPSPRILLAWELGANRGYLKPLAGLVAAWRQLGADILVASKDPVASQHDLAPLGVRFTRAPTPVQLTGGDALNYAGLLAHAGWSTPDLLAGLIRSWRTLFDLYRPDVLVAHHAPTALLASQGDTPRAWRIGSGFVCPPRTTPYPHLRPWISLPRNRLADMEKALLAKVNAGLSLADRPTIPTLAQAFAHAQDILLTVPELDHYGPREKASDYWGLPPRDGSWPVMALHTSTHNEGRILGYVWRKYPHFSEALAPLAGTGRVVRLYCPDASDADLQPSRWGKQVTLSRTPLNLTRELPEAAAFVCHGGHATSLEALQAGVPLLLLPTQIEQYLLGQCVEAMGTGRQINPEAHDRPYAHALSDILNNPAYREAAHAFACQQSTDRNRKTWGDVARHNLMAS